MAQVNTLDTMNGMFKTVYADNESNLIPDGVKLLPMIPFSKKHALGKSYSVPVLLQSEHGISFGVTGKN